MQEQQGNLMPKLSGLPGPRPYNKRGKMKNKQQQQLAEYLGTAIGMLAKTKVGRGAVKGGLKVLNKAKRTKAGKAVSDFSKTDLGGAVVGNVATAAPGWALGKVQQIRARKQAEAEERRQRAEQKKRKRASAWEDGDVEKEEMNEYNTGKPAIVPGVDVPPNSTMGREATASQTPKKDPTQPDGLAKPKSNAPSQGKPVNQNYTYSTRKNPLRRSSEDSPYWLRGIDYLKRKQDAELEKQKSGYYTKGRVEKTGRPASDFYRPGSSYSPGAGRGPTKRSGMGKDLRSRAFNRKHNTGTMKSRGHFQKLKEGTMTEQEILEKYMSIARGIGTMGMGSVRPGIDVPRNSTMGRAAIQSQTPSGTGRGRYNAPSQNPVRTATVSDGGAAQRRRKAAKTKSLDPLTRRNRALDQSNREGGLHSFVNPYTGKRQKFVGFGAELGSAGKKAPSEFDMYNPKGKRPTGSGTTGKTPTGKKPPTTPTSADSSTAGGGEKRQTPKLGPEFVDSMKKMATGLAGIGKDMADKAKTPKTPTPKAQTPTAPPPPKADPTTVKRVMRGDQPRKLTDIAKDRQRERESARFAPKTPTPKPKPEENWGEYGPGGYGTGNRLGPSMRQRRDQFQRGADYTGSPGAQREADRYTELNRIRRASMPQWQRDMEDANQAKWKAINADIRRRNQQRRGGLRLR